MRDTEYQKIFNVATKIKVGNEYIEKAGMNLRKFMNDLLDGDELYRTSSSGKEQGAQAKFLDKYFGYVATDATATNFGNNSQAETEAAANASTSGDIKDIKLDTVLNENIAYDKPTDLENTFFVLQSSENLYYCYIHRIVDNKVYFSYSETAFHILNYIKRGSDENVNGNYKINNPNMFKILKKGDGPDKVYPIKASTIRFDLFINKEGKLIVPTTYYINWLQKGEGDEYLIKPDTGSEKNQSVKAYQLCDLEKGAISNEKKRLKVKPNLVDIVIKKEGGFLNIKNIIDSKGPGVGIKGS
jgi:hypothetical protein